MRILITCDRYPGDLSDGLTLRVYNYVSRLKSRHDFDLICFDHEGTDSADSHKLFRRIIRFPPPTKKLPTNLFSHVLEGIDYRTLYLISPETREHIAELIREESYDLVWDAGCNMLLNIEPLRSAGIPLLADQVDDSFLRLKRDLHRVTNWYSKLWIIKQIILQWRFAKRYLANAEAVLFVSDADVRFFKRLFPLANAVVIENGVDEAYFKPQPLAPEDETIGDPEIVFEGAMCFSPNIDAACFMACEIFPLIRREIPDVRLTLVGRDPVAEVEDLATIDGVEVTGTVPDIRPYLQRAQVFICPMRTGAGIKNKILQAWAMGKAIVSTNEGSGGLKVIDGKNIVIRNTPQSFATSVVELLRDPVKACQLGVAGRETVLAHYTWAAKAEEFEKLMISIVREHKTKTLDRQLKEKRCG